MTEDDFDQADIDRFWRTIDAAGRDRERLRAALMSMTKEEVYQFQDIFVEMAVELRGEPHTFYVAPGESEDGIEDISNWVVSQGRKQYEAVLADPQPDARRGRVGRSDDPLPGRLRRLLAALRRGTRCDVTRRRATDPDVTLSDERFAADPHAAAPWHRHCASI